MHTLTSPSAPPPLTPESIVAMDPGALTTQLAEDALRQLHADLCRAIADGEAIAAKIAALGGSSPSFLPQHLITMTQMGTGYFRHSRDVLNALFRARNQAATAKP